MKLKKIASLMLAGVMAISMLAGCSGKGETKPEEPATGVNANTVIAALDKKVTDKVTFTASSSLQTTLEKAVQYAGVTDSSDIGTDALVKFDDKLSEDWFFTAASEPASEDAVKKAASITYVEHVTNQANYNEKYIVDQLAQAIEDAKVYKRTNTIAELPDYTKTNYTVDKDEYYYSFDYTGEVAVVEVGDVVNNDVSYVIAFTITRTPTKTSVPSKG